MESAETATAMEVSYLCLVGALFCSVLSCSYLVLPSMSCLFFRLVFCRAFCFGIGLGLGLGPGPDLVICLVL